MVITLITPTGLRPEAFALCERWIRRQTYKGELQWLVVDDGEVPTRTTLGQQYIRQRPFWNNENRRNTQRDNLRAAVPHIEGDAVLIIEDDDYYAPRYIETMARMLEKADLVGEAPARYYHVGNRAFYVHRNSKHSSLCSTGMRGDAIDVFTRTIEPNYTAYIDLSLWDEFEGKKLLSDIQKSVGMKGMPGRLGIGNAHRWGKHTYVQNPDQKCEQLDLWLGDDAKYYRPYLGKQESA